MAKVKMDPIFAAALESFKQQLQAKIDEHMTKSGFDWEVRIEMQEGQRYVKVIKLDHGSRSVHCFVDKTNGNILKAASWRAPVKETPRGSIFNRDQLSGVTVYGAAYLK